MDSDLTPWSIYSLVDPDTNAVRYVGKAQDPDGRLQRHLTKAKGLNHPTAQWLRGVQANGKSPVIQILESGTGPSWKAAERKWIAHFRAQGINLTNVAEGGGGGSPHPHTPETKARMSASHTGIVQSPETLAKRSLAATAQRAREKQEKAAALAANPPPPSPPKRVNKGWRHTDATRATMSAAAKARGAPKHVVKREPGFHMTEESKQKLGVAISATATRKREAREAEAPTPAHVLNPKRVAAQRARREREAGAAPSAAPAVPKDAPKHIPLETYRARKAANAQARRDRLAAEKA